MKQNTRFEFPLYRYDFDNYYILSYRSTSPPKAEILIIEDREKINDFFLGMGLKVIKSFEAETWRKAYNKAKKWALKHFHNKREK